MPSCKTTKSEKGNCQGVQMERCKQSVDNPIFINDSLCRYYKCLWSKCKRIWTNKYIHNFWVANGSVKIKAKENSKPNTISHITDLQKIFPGNKLLKDEESESNQ